RKRFVCGGLMTHGLASLRYRSIVVVRKDVGACSESSEFGRGQYFLLAISSGGDGPVRVCFSNGSWRQEHCVRVLLAHKRLKNLEVTPKRRSVVVFGCAAHHRQRRLVHELRCGHRATIFLGESEPAPSLVGLPDSICPSR